MSNNSVCFFLLLLFIGMLRPAYTQSKYTAGKILYEEDKKPVSYAEVFVFGYSDYKARTDAQGTFSLPIPEELADLDAVRVIVKFDEAHQPIGYLSIRADTALLMLPRPVDFKTTDPTARSFFETGSPELSVYQSFIILKKEVEKYQGSHPELYRQWKELLQSLEKGMNNPDRASDDITDLPGDEASSNEEVVRVKIEEELENHEERSLQIGLDMAALSTEELVDAFENLEEHFVHKYKENLQGFDAIQEDISTSLIISPTKIAKLREKLKSLEENLARLKSSFWDKAAQYRIVLHRAQQKIDSLKTLLAKDSDFVRLHKTLYYGLMSFLAILALLLLTLFLLFWRLRKKKRQLSTSWQRIDVQNKEIYAKNEKLAAQQEKLSELNQKLKLSLEETHHRIKNHLQRTGNLLDLSVNNGHSLEEVVDNIRGRIYSMALIHKKLQNTDRLDQVNLQEYVQELLISVSDTFRPLDKNIRCTASVPALSLDITTATDLGLIINELVSNAYKYAFIQTNEGSIEVRIFPTTESHYTLRVKDDGQGLPQDLDFDNPSTLGLSLTHGLAERLEGEVEAISPPGTCINITFKAQAFALEESPQT